MRGQIPRRKRAPQATGIRSQHQMQLMQESSPTAFSNQGTQSGKQAQAQDHVQEQWPLRTCAGSMHHQHKPQPTRTQIQHVRSLKTRPLYALFELFKSLACVSKIISPNSNYWQTSPMGNQRWRKQSVVQLARIFTFEFTPLTKKGKTY